MKNTSSGFGMACVLVLPLAALLVFLPSAEAQVQPVNWTHLSSATGDLPLPPYSSGQSGLRVVDLDKNGQDDYVITLWSAAETVVWYRQMGNKFEKYVIDTETPNLSHGEKFKDIDGDGDIDLLFGDASSGNKIYWWENPYPNYESDTPWERRIVRDSGGNFYHDNIWGDFDGDGADELIAWNQYGLQLLLFEIPADPKKNSSPWPATQIFSWTSSAFKYRGAEAADINLDGKIDFVGGGGWFEHTGGTNFTFHPIDAAMGYSQIKAGQFIPGGRPEVVCVLELTDGPLNMYEWTGSEWQTQTILGNVPRSHTLQIGDINQDGHLDIMIGELGQWSPTYEPPDNPDAKISVLYGDGLGNFVQQVVFEGLGDLEGQLADIDNDGDLDIVAKPFRHNIPRVDIHVNQMFTPVVDVPNVVGLSQSAAEEDILAAGFTVGTVSFVYSNTEPVGDVINQEPISGTSVPTGWPVDLLVSSGVGAYQQDFEEYAGNEDPPDWLDTAADSSMTKDDNLFKVFDLSGEKVFGTSSTATNIHSHYIDGAIDTFTAYEFSGRMMITEPTGGIGLTFLSQYPTSDAYYRLRRHGSGSFHFSPHGTTVSGEIDTGVVPLPNQWHRFRIQVEDMGYRTEIRARVWLDGDMEPLFWQVEAYDDTPSRLIAGTIGVWSYEAGSKYWDDLIMGPLVQQPAAAEVPDVVWLSEADAEAAIVASGLSVGAVTTAYSDTVAAGNVISQAPVAGTSVPSGSAVDLVVSIGPQQQMVDVPDVVGLSQAEAETAILVSGLSVGVSTSEYNDTVPAGFVVSQYPIAGTSVPSGSAVDFVVSLGPQQQMVNVPDVSGLSQAEAATAVVASGLSVGAVTSEYSDTVPAGFVVSQSPMAGTSVPSGSAVDLVVSLGPQQQMVDVPNVVGLSQADAETAIVASGLSVGAVTSEYSDTVPAGIVVSQYPVAGTSVSSGSTVNFTVSLGPSAYQNGFESYGDGEDPVDWLDTDANNSMAEDDSLFKVFDLGGEKAFGTTSTSANIHSHSMQAGSSSLTDYEYTGRMMITEPTGGIGVTFFSRYPMSDAYYRLRRYGSNDFHIAPHGTTVSGDIDTGVVPLPNVWYQFKIQVGDTGSQTDIRAKVWQEGTAEPADWQASATDASAGRLTIGTFGLWSYYAGDKFWDDLAVVPLGAPLQQFELILEPTGSGRVDLDPPGGIYDEGVVVQLTAVADPGWEFSVWGGDLSGSANPTAITMDSDKSVTATFLPLPVLQYSLAISVEPAGTGSVSLDPSGGVYDEGTEVQLTATATAGWEFTGWSGDLIDTANPTVMTMTADKTVTANFMSALDVYFESFTEYAAGSDPDYWLDTAANNSMAADDSLFKVFDLDGETVVFGTASTQTNIHSHYAGDGSDSLMDYEYTGRMMMTEPASGIGVTFYSQYPMSDSYYRLRRYGSNDFHISPHGTTVSGDIDTGVVPLPNVWYRFKIQVEDTGSQTAIRAKVWQEGTAEPADWQASAADESAGRLTAGTFGLWSYYAGGKFWDDIAVSATDGSL